jgi:hypothetical protein
LFWWGVIILIVIRPMTGKNDLGRLKYLIKDLIRGVICGPIGTPKSPKHIAAAA